MQKAAWVIVIVAAGAVGAYLVAGYGDDGRYRSRLRRHLEIMDEQLSSLEVHLRRFKESRGRYPSTDEGLSVLDNFAARMKVIMFRYPEAHRRDGLYSFDARGYMRHSSGFWSVAQERLRHYRIEHGRVPRTLAEMREAGVGWNLELQSTADQRRAPLLEDEEMETVERELAIGHDDVVFLIGPAVVLSPWQMPYVYENRRDAHGALFADSPADSYFAERYSVKIDDGVYIWSVCGRQYSDRYHALWLWDVMIRCSGAGLILLAAVLIWWKIPDRAKRLVAMGLMISAASGAASARVLQVTCYIASPMFSRRDPAMVSRRIELLDKYRAAGAISDETYDKSLESMGRKPTQTATTRPNEGE